MPIFTSVEITNEQGITLTLPLDDSGSYLVKDIEGLDPVDAQIVTNSFAGQDGEEEQSSRRGKRNIIFKLGYNAPNVRALRQQLYGFFMPKSHVTMRFYAEDLDMFYVTIDGTIETFKSPMFAKDPEAMISIICVEPDFQDPEPVAWHGDTVTTDFQWLLTNAGSIETGFVMTMNITDSIAGVTIHHRTTAGGPMNDLMIVSPFIAGDLLTISTVPGNKYVTRTRSGVKVSLMYDVDRDSVWTLLYPGKNYFRVNAGTAGISYTVQYTNKYGGL